MNKDLLEPFIKIATVRYGPPYKVTETPEVINHCWENKNNNSLTNEETIRALERIRKYAVDNNWVLDNVDLWNDIVFPSKTLHLDFFSANLSKRWAPAKVYRTFFSICYDKAKDKISLSNYVSGLGLSQTNRIHPISKNQPLLCISKKIYAFKQWKVKRRFKYHPRIYTGMYYTEELKPYLARVLNCTEDVLKLHIPYRHMKNAGLEVFAFMNAFGDEVVADMIGIKPPGEKPWNFNWLIDISGGRPVELMKIVKSKIDEEVTGTSKNPADVFHQAADFLHERFFDKDSDILFNF